MSIFVYSFDNIVAHIVYIYKNDKYLYQDPSKSIHLKLLFLVALRHPNNVEYTQYYIQLF